MVAENGAHLAPIRAMLAVLDDDARETLARALHQHVHAPPSAAKRRVAELGFLARLLNEQPQPPDRLPYVSRKLYDQRRESGAPDAPLSARLQERFGSWQRACHAAWGLLSDGRSWGPGEPWSRPPRHPKNYTVDEVVASVRACAEAVGHIPSSGEFHWWVINRRARARQRGESTRPFAPYASVMRLVAPDRRGGNGWRLVVKRVFGDSEIPQRSSTAPAGHLGEDTG